MRPGFDDGEPPLHKFRVYVRSAPGMWETYSGHVDVWAADQQDAFERSVRELGRTSFPDRRHCDAWVFEKAEAL